MSHLKNISLDKKHKQLRRHLFSIYHTATPGKLWNLGRCYLSYRRKASHLKNMPAFAKFEISTACNLKCPGCLHSTDTDIYRQKALMSFDTFKAAIDRLRPCIFKAIMYHQGESFLNPNLLEMVKYATSQRIDTSISTNFSFRFDDDKLAEILRSGLSHLIVSVDGTSQEVYQKYRVGGNLDFVLSNISRLVELKKKHGKKSPLLEFQFLIFDHNKHQLADAHKLARELGMDRFSTKTDKRYSEGTFLGDTKRDDLIQIDETRIPGCKWLWFGTVIKADGTVMPCCMYNWGEDISKVCFGNIHNADFADIWNGKRYRISRKSICSNADKVKYQNETICSRCPAWGASHRTRLTAE